MKKSIFLLLTLMSTSIFACPDISGQFICNSKYGSMNIQVIKTNNIPTFKTIATIGTETQESTMIVDEVERASNVIENGVIYTSYETYTCENGQYVETFRETSSDNSYSMNGVTKISQDDLGDLNISSNSNHTYGDGRREVDTDNFKCSKIN